MAQNNACGMSASGPNSHSASLGLLGNAALNFYEGNQGCDDTEINVNFILLYRDDWTGNFDLNNAEESTFFWFLRQEFLRTIQGELSAMDNCNDDVVPNLVFKQKVFQINDTEAWDANGCDGFIPTGSPCFDDTNFCPEPYASKIESVISSIGGEKDINAYFPVEGIVWKNFENLAYLRTCVDDRINIGPWLGRFPTTGNLNQFVVSQISNVYPRYLNARDRPDCFPNDPNTIIPELYTNMGRAFAHEIGHNFSLTHRNSCVKAVMQNNTCCANGFKYLDSEIAKVNRALSIKNVRNSRGDCNTNKNCYFTLPAGQVLHVDFDAWIDRNILIESGATLIVEKEMKMANDAVIDIESGGRLIVDGGVITSCDDLWRGIRVTGGNSDYDVKIYNGARIENTRQHAVSMFPPNIPWPEVQNFGNGILIAENSTFLNCDALAGFVAFSPSANKSRITNCMHIGGKWGVTNWHSEGVIVKDCTFENISEHCIGAFDGTYDLIDNHFYGGTQEVLFTNTKAGKISTIEGNTFNTAPIGLRAIGSHTGFLNIVDNTFHSSETGIAMELINNYSIFKNTFLGQEKEGILCQQNGVNLENDINENLFEGNKKGIIAALDNDKLSFLRNCFNTNNIDVEIYGLVALQMGGSSPAGNCFTHKGSVSSGIEYAIFIINSLIIVSNIIKLSFRIAFP